MAVGLVSACAGSAGVWWTAREARNEDLDLGAITGVFSLGLSALGLIVGVGSLAVSWLSYRADRREHAGETAIGGVADRLALAVRGQWEAEAQLRRLNDPYPLPVSWRPADQNLVEPWPLLLQMATRHGRETQWASCPDDLAGADSEITDVLTRRAPGRRLLVLGEPGAGKTMLLVVLLLGLLDRRTSGDPVPVIFPIASWNPAQGLESWMADRLTTDYPALRQHTSEQGRQNSAQALLDNRMIFPILDGLDEIEPSKRSVALTAINAALPPGRPVVLSSRSVEYGQALSPDTGVPQRLNGAAGIVLEPLTRDIVAAYLRRDAGGEGTPAADRWNPVLEQLAQRSPLATVLVTPLALFLARTIYNPRPGEAGPRLPDPAELCNEECFPDETALRTHLLNAFVPAAYRTHSLRPCPWTPARAEHILRKLAQHLENRRHGRVDIAWWELRYALPAPALTMLTASTVSLLVLVLSFAGYITSDLLSYNLFGEDYTWLSEGFLIPWFSGFGAFPEFLAETLVPSSVGYHVYYWGEIPWVFLAGPFDFLTVGFLVALCFLVDGVARLRSRFAPARRLRLSFNSRTLIVSLLCALTTGLLVTLGFGHPAGVSWAVVALSISIIIMGLTAIPVDARTAVSPKDVFREDRRSCAQFLLAPVLGGGLLLAPGIMLGHAAADETLDLTSYALSVASGIGFWVGIAIGLALALNRTAWGRFTLIRLYLVLRWRIPWNLMAFLDDAHRHRGVLRQAGSVYQFRHVDLQRHLASSDATSVARPPVSTLPSAADPST
ncbi:NACHT domain-containing protein [Streptomyces sp. NPDC002680]|uniref:NACHT domain-containing protein n=1 Tax=Streptomyces sp. NPDC002680 TaxID=3364659 RepID=UPI0036B8AD96